MAPFFNFKRTSSIASVRSNKFNKAAPSVLAAIPSAFPLPLAKPTLLPPLEIDSSPLLDADLNGDQINTTSERTFEDEEEAALWLACSDLPFDSVKSTTEPKVNFTAPFSAPTTTRGNVTRKEVPKLLTIQLGSIRAVFEVEDNHEWTRPVKEEEEKPAECDFGSDNGSATDLESSPRSFGDSANWSSSSSSSSSEDEHDAPVPSASSPLPPFELVFPSFAPRIYRSISTLSSPIFDYPVIPLPSPPLSSPQPQPQSRRSSIRRKSPPSLTTAERVDLERKEKLDKPTRIQVDGKSVFINHPGMGERTRSASGRMSNAFSGSQWIVEQVGVIEDEEEEVLVISNRNSMCGQAL